MGRERVIVERSHTSGASCWALFRPGIGVDIADISCNEFHRSMVIYLVVAVRRKAIESSHFQLPNSNLVVLWTSVDFCVHACELHAFDTNG